MTKTPKARPLVRLPPDYLRAVGAITTNAALMDKLIDHTIAVFLRTSPTIGRRITEPILSTARKIDLLKGIGDEIAPDGPLKDQFCAVCAKLSSAQAHRSKIVHARWGYRPKTDSFYVVWFEPGEDQPVTDPMPLQTLLNYGRQLDQARKALEKFLDSVDFVPWQKDLHVWPPFYHTRERKKKK